MTSLLSQPSLSSPPSSSPQKLFEHKDNRDMSQARILSQFFTNPKTAKWVTEETKRILTEIDPHTPFNHYTFVEPSAGDNVFCEILNTNPFDVDQKSMRAVEVDPELCKRHSHYIQTDINSGGFLSTDLEMLHLTDIDKSKIIAIGNPPYSQPRSLGRSRNIALDFVNHACTMADTVAFILGTTFRRPITQSKINPYFHLVYDTNLPYLSFTLDSQPAKVSTVFQIWKRKQYPRPPDPYLKLVNRDGTWDGGDWKYVKPTNTSANIRIVKWGSHATVGRMDPLHEVGDIVRHNIEKTQQKWGHGCKPPVSYSPDNSHYYICAQNPEKTFNNFLQRKHLIYQLAKDRTMGKNPDLTKKDFVMIYKTPSNYIYDKGKYIDPTIN